MFKEGLFCGVFLFLTVKCIPFQNEIINAISNWAPMVILLICLVVYIFLINYCKKYAEEWFIKTKDIPKPLPKCFRNPIMEMCRVIIGM